MSKSHRLGKILTIALAFVGLVGIVVTATPAVSWWARGLAGAWEDSDGDTLIVLGGSMLDNDTMGPSSYWRTVYAMWAYRDGHFRRVLLSGGSTGGTPVSGAMERFMECNGVPRAVMVLEPRSTNTRDSAVYTRQLLANDSGKNVLLTSDYHMLRASRAFRKAGVDISPRPFPDALKRASSYSGRWGVFLDLVRETGAVAYYFARGWI
jgi:uncharacterized SAM-binding protein YcdF (DUF218 family)